MIKIILAKVGEGKTRECIKEIEQSGDSYSIGVFSDDCDFSKILSDFGNKEVLSTKDIMVHNSPSTAEDVLKDGYKYDMIVLDLNRNWKDLSDAIKNSDCNNIIITQQLSLGW